MNRTRRAGILAAVIAGAFAISACAGGGGGGGGSDEERIYVRAMNGDAMTSVGLNAQVGSTLNARTFSAQILDTLILISGDSELSPGLAESWELSEDGLALTLTLRQGVTWHDGEPFTAEDVKFNIEEIFPIQVYGAQLAERVDSVEIVDDSTVVVHMSEPYGPLVETLATQFMLPKHLYEGTDYVTNPANKEGIIGTGPMMFGSYTPGQEIVLEKNPDYWGGEVQVDRAVFTQIPDANSRAEALFSGEVDEAILDPSQQDRVADDENVQLIEDAFFSEVQTMIFNTQSEYLKDPAVRKAVFAAIDRDALVETGLAGVGEPANGFFPPAFDWAVNEDIDFDRDFPRDLDAINQTLDDAGFERDSDGIRFTLKMEYIESSSDTGAIVEMIQSMLNEVGIATEYTGNSGAIWSEKTYSGDFDLSFVRTSLGGEPSIGITRWYMCNEERVSGKNPSGICDPEIDGAVADALESIDQDKRAEAYKVLQDRARDLLFHAPLAWSTAGYPTVNGSRWDGLDEPAKLVDRKPWLTMSPVE